MNELREDGRIISGQPHYRTEVGAWRPYAEEQEQERLRQIEDNPAPSIKDNDQ